MAASLPLYALERPRRDERFHAVSTRAQVLEDLERLSKDVARKDASYAAMLLPSERPLEAEAHAGRLAHTLDTEVPLRGPLEIFPLGLTKGVLDVFTVSRDVLDGEDHSAKIKEHEAALERQALAQSRKGQGKSGEKRAQGPGNTRMSTILGGGKGKGEAREAGAGAAGGRGEKRGAAGAGGQGRRKMSKRDIESDTRQRIRAKRRAKKISALLAPVVERLWALQEPALGNPFRTVIDRNTMVPLGIPDYFDYVSKPMNLQWMREKVAKKEYATVEAFEDDLRLMVSNAKKYNGEGNAVWPFADKLLHTYETDLRVQEPLDSDQEN